MTPRMLRRGMWIAAGLGAAAFLAEVSGALPGAGRAITPLLVGCVIVYLLWLGDRWNLPNLPQGQPSERPDEAEPPRAARLPAQPDYRGIAWHGFTLRSQAEVKIAKALDQAGVVFLAGARVRLDAGDDHRQTREVDFLVTVQGRWGVLEVDGPQHDRSAESDRARDARLEGLGLVVRRYPADRCTRQPEGVVGEFLEQLLVRS
ncbi:MAG: DUF559 domain-containing protein [Anaerolineae bacterium]|nr:DUF559 domain-containing protein [Anaerolineae bacterium]